MEYAPEVGPSYAFECGQGLVELYQKTTARLHQVAAYCAAALSEMAVVYKDRTDPPPDSEWPKLKTHPPAGGWSTTPKDRIQDAKPQPSPKHPAPKG